MDTVSQNSQVEELELHRKLDRELQSAGLASCCHSPVDRNSKIVVKKSPGDSLQRKPKTQRFFNQLLALLGFWPKDRRSAAAVREMPQSRNGLGTASSNDFGCRRRGLSSAWKTRRSRPRLSDSARGLGFCAVSGLLLPTLAALPHLRAR